MSSSRAQNLGDCLVPLLALFLRPLVACTQPPTLPLDPSSTAIGTVACCNLRSSPSSPLVPPSPPLPPPPLSHSSGSGVSPGSAVSSLQVRQFRLSRFGSFVSLGSSVSSHQVRQFRLSRFGSFVSPGSSASGPSVAFATCDAGSCSVTCSMSASSAEVRCRRGTRKKRAPRAPTKRLSAAIVRMMGE